jgi:hypothetical protein
VAVKKREYNASDESTVWFDLHVYRVANMLMRYGDLREERCFQIA